MTSTTTRPPQPPPYRHHHNHNHYPTTPSYYSPTSSTPSLLKGCCCCLFLLISLLFLLLLAVFLIILLALKPKKPHFDLQQVAVQNLAILPTTTAATTVSLSIRLIFTASNPNKVGIKYGHSRFTLMYRGIPLGTGTLDGFYQPADSVNTVSASVAVDKVSLMQSDGSDLVKDASLYDKVEFRVLGDVTAKVRVFQVDSPGVQVSVDCLIVISPRSQSLTYKQCGFDGLSV